MWTKPVQQCKFDAFLTTQSYPKPQPDKNGKGPWDDVDVLIAGSRVEVFPVASLKFRHLPHLDIHMPRPIILASGSQIRQALLNQARVPFDVVVPRLDEQSIKIALLEENAAPQDIADALAEHKALKISKKFPDSLVIGCDQTLEHGRTILTKPDSPESAREQLAALRGDRHHLYSAAVICHQANPIWRHVGRVRLEMRTFSDRYLDGYIERNWESIRHAVGAYKLEEEGVRLFSRIDGDYFSVLGLPLLEILAYLGTSGDLET